MSIGEVAGHFGLAAHVLRHWETMGLLSPARATGGRRRYGRSDLYRVGGILLAKEAGLALTDIRDILTIADIEKRREITRRHRDELVRRIEEMRAALNLIEGGLTCGYEDITECPSHQQLTGPPPGSLFQPGQRWMEYSERRARRVRAQYSNVNPGQSVRFTPFSSRYQL
jgi:DNA-binding transcriptional MerR regulator